MNMTQERIVQKRNEHLKVLVTQYAQSILELVNSIKSSNINQVVSLIKANIRVLESDVKQSFTKHDTQDFNYREYN